MDDCTAAVGLREPVPRERNDQPGRGGSGFGTELEEIIVTATKRSERIQDIPVSVTAFTGKQLTEMGADTFVDYAREVPSLTFAERGNGRNDIAIRGLSVINGVPTVAYYLDGISTELNFQSPDPKLFDIQRIEILRGPQGTLYGAGAVGGLIQVSPILPTLPDSTPRRMSNISASTMPTAATA